MRKREDGSKGGKRSIQAKGKREARDRKEKGKG
jgi:hypothetical protein